MPYIGTRTSTPISAEKEEILKSRLGSAIELLPGKTERWLMTEFVGDCRLWFGGDNSKPSAFVEVKIFGKSDAASYEKLTAEICKIMHDELNIPANRTYVKYEEVSNWGWNSTNF